MITYLLLTVLAGIMGMILGFLPTIETLPNFMDYDIDVALINAVAWYHKFSELLFPLVIFFQGFLIILGYYSVKIVLNLFLGHRAP